MSGGDEGVVVNIQQHLQHEHEHVIDGDGDCGEDKNRDSTLVRGIKSFISGSMGGFACKIVEYPFDTLKVLQQRQEGKISVVSTLRGVVHSHGFLGLYKGLTAPLIGSMLENAVLFAGYETSSSVLNKANIFTSGVPHYMTCGFFAGVGVSFVLTPVELIKCRLQVENLDGAKAAYKGPMDAARTIYKMEGVRGLYRGHIATMLRECPGNTAWFTTYNVLRRQLVDEDAGEELKWYHSAIAGGVSGMTYWTAFYPADTVKTHQQTNPIYEGKSFSHTFKDVFRRQGTAGLYKGWLLTVSRAVPSNAVLFMTFELFARLIG
eukprot:m.127619 g.127619  ORF g.127619 m.127619 type:complete len:320 (+) comp13014_c0_seq3:51-1010(+)